jgi:small-conductance mechanosensitive channel
MLFVYVNYVVSYAVLFKRELDNVNFSYRHIIPPINPNNADSFLHMSCQMVCYWISIWIWMMMMKMMMMKNMMMKMMMMMTMQMMMMIMMMMTMISGHKRNRFSGASVLVPRGANCGCFGVVI